MIRITALNDESESGSSDEEEPKITREAEETIAVSEYMRALKFMNANRTDDALSLFTELLDTEVLNEVSKESADNKLFYTKYNCHKNLGFIYTKKGAKAAALDHLLSAFELDDTDVFTANKLGQLALEMQKLEIAQIAFEKCLLQNPNHWPSADGVLQVLCLKESYNEAYGWALMWYEKDNGYQRGLDVILEIREKFHDFGFEFIENSWKIKFDQPDLRRIKEESVFPGYSVDDACASEKPDFSAFKLDELSWLSFGALIVKMYEHFKDTAGVAYSITLDDLLRETSVGMDTGNGESPMLSYTEVATPGCTVGTTNGLDDATTDRDMDVDSDQKDNSNSNNDVVFLVPAVTGGASDQQTSGEGSAAEDSDSKIHPEGGVAVASDNAKRKVSRRRGSDLSFLEQWGWHKNKRYVTRKKGSHDRSDPDATINGILRRILPKFFEVNFNDGDTSPFINDQFVDCENILTAHHLSRSPVSCDEFQAATNDDFVDFLNELKVRHFDLMEVLLKWCQHVSQYWDQRVPIELQKLYLQIYVYSLNHCDLATWNLLSTRDFKAAFRMAIFYLELFHDAILKTATYGSKNDIDERWLMLFYHVLFHSGMYEIEHDETEFAKHKKRLYWLHYCVAQYEYDLDKAVDWLYTIEQLIRSTGDGCLELPNQQQNDRIDLKTIVALKSSLERNIRLNSVKGLYAAQKFSELIDILIDSLANSTSTQTNDGDCIPLNVSTQFEILLEAFWTLELFEDCLIWSERCLKYALDRFVRAPSNTCSQSKWAESVSFVLTYIEALILGETISIVSCLDKYYARLVQNITIIVAHQLDAQFDKNNNPMHLINTKMPWVILHHILEREEYIESAANFKKAIAPIDGGDFTGRPQHDEALPNSLIVFFTAHEYLGVRSWCTKHNGGLLLYIMDIVATRLRAPFLEPYRDIVAEYLEQVTYCLYGYPAKKARARHIEEHNACNVDLTWSRAVQLFDLYRPDSLPEFNSYKNDSISIDMEVLLQRIVALVPADIDASARTTGILNFIMGTTTELPVAFAQLPYQIYCIYYLLADFYFKKPDFAKSIDYYVLDLTTCPNRFDSWAGLALSKASILETRLNTCDDLSTNEFLTQSEEVLRCFQQCFKLDDNQVAIWIEYGNFAYTMHSFCSRSLKQSSATMSMERFHIMEEKKEQCLKIASDCFTTVDQSTTLSRATGTVGESDVDDSHDEKWLYHYMLGKIAEKRKEQPDVFIGHYIQSAKYLYEHNASYPFKISHSDPQNLSVEALEVYYRITSSIVKYIEQNSTITRAVGRMFIRILKEVNASPFALNQAKIDDNSINALKRKITLANEEAAAKKLRKDDETDTSASIVAVANPSSESKAISDEEVILLDDAAESSTPCSPEPAIEMVAVTSPLPIPTTPPPPPPPSIIESEPLATADLSVKLVPLVDTVTIDNDNLNSPSRRGSQESNATTTTTGTTTTATTGSDSSTSSSSESSSSDSSSSDDSDTDSSDDDPKKADQALSEHELETIYKICIKNLEECVTRFPEHYKSMYRLANIYLHAPAKIKDLQRCRQLLLATYTTGLGNQIQGLFVERKQINLFNGIWRIPSSEIDRPGSFSAHLSKCISILIEVLRLSADYQTLMEISLQLNRHPESDKRYIKQVERKELSKQAVSFCNQAFRQVLKEHSCDKRDERELLSLLIDVYNAQKRCVKQMESVLSALLVDTYKAYLERHVARFPDNINYLDYANKLCVHEIGLRKNLSKNGGYLPPPFSLPESVLPAAILKAMQPPVQPIVPTVPAFSQSLPPPMQPVNLSAKFNTPIHTTTIGTIPSMVKPPQHATSIISTVTPTTTQTTAMAQSLSSAVTTSSSSYAVSSASLTHNSVPLQPRPRGRPPGSKNINVGQLPMPATTMPSTSPFLGAASSSFASGRFDLASMAALLGMFNNTPMITTPQQYSDSTAVAALLNEYYKQASSVTGAAMKATPPVGTGLPPSYLSSLASASTSSTPQSKMPQFDIQSFLSSSSGVATSSTTMPTASTSMSVSSNKQQGALAASSTIISVGSGQLTITPSTVMAKQTKDLQMSSAVPGSSLSSRLFSDMPGISVTKVKSKTSTAHGSVAIPKDLPKSLTITPTPAGYTNKPVSHLSQYPHVTMQPEKLVKPPNKRKRQQKNTTPTVPNPAAMSAMAYAFGSGRSLPSQYTPLPTSAASAAAAFTMQDYTQLAMLSQYSDLMKSLDPLWAPFDGFSKVANSSSSSKPAKQNRSRAKKSKTTVTPATMRSTSLTMQQQQQPPPPYQAPPAKGSGRGSSLQSMQQQQQQLQNASPKPFANMSQPSLPHHHNPQTPSPKLQQKFQIPDVPGRNMSPYGMSTATNTSPISAHSPNKSPVLPPPMLSPGHHQISPQKTLQQILAEKQKAFSDANQVAAAAAARSSSSIGSSSAVAPSAEQSSTSSKPRKSDNIIILD